MIENRAAELYQCAECSAELDHPGAECPACLYDPARELEEAHGDAFELPAAWDELESPAARLGRWAGHAAHVLAGTLVAVAGAALFLLILWGFLTPEAEVIPVVNAWKADAWAWFTADAWAWLLIALLAVVAAAAVRVAVLVKP